MKIAVIALGKIGLPLAVQFASKGHEVVGVDVNRQVVDLINAGIEPFPGEARLQEQLPSWCPPGSSGRPPTTRMRSPSADVVVLVVPLFVDADANPTSAGWTRRPPNWRKHLTPTPSCPTRPPCRSAPPAPGGSRCPGRGLRADRGHRTSTSCSRPERVLTGRVFADLRKYPKLVGGLSDDGRRQGASSSTRPCSTSTTGPTWPAPTASGTWAPPRPPRWRSSPKPPTATSTSAWPTSSPASPPRPASTSTR